MMRRSGLAFLAVLVCSTAAQAAPVLVRFVPNPVKVQVDVPFTVYLVADIPDPVLGWGLDLNFDPGLLVLKSLTLGPLWFPADAADGDGLVGLAFPDPVSGSETLLASLVFSMVRSGTASLAASYDAADLTEGFALFSGGFAEVTFEEGTVAATTIPEPTSALLSLAGLVVIASVVKRKGSRRVKN